MVNTEANRRIGARNPVAVPVTVMHTPDGRRGLRRIVAAKLKGRITNVSVSGAELVTRPVPWIKPRARVLIGDETGAALAEVRRVDHVEKDKIRWGVLFIEIDPAFEAALHQASGYDQDQDQSWRWNRAD